MSNQTNQDYRILIVDDDVGQAEMLREFLRISGFSHVDHVENIYSLWQALKRQVYDIILLDYMLPDGTGLSVLKQMPGRGYRLPVVMVTGQGNERTAAEAIQLGAVEYVIKTDYYLVTIPPLIHKAINAHQLQLSVERSLEQIRYQALLLNNVRDAIVVWDLSGKITYWNPAAAALFGWEAEERLGQLVEQVYLPMFAQSISLPGENDAPGLGQHVSRKCTRRDGKTIWISSRVAALRDPGVENRLTGYMDVSYDISATVAQEQALRESEARYRAIVEDYQTELICRFKPNGSLTFVNEVYCRYFNQERNELLGMNFLFFLPESERAKVIQHLAQFNPQRPVATLEHQVIVSGNGMNSLRWLQRTDRAIFDAQEHIFEFQSMGRDITERKKMEAQIQAAQAHLVQAARLTTIGEMASGVAHQIYNPLTTIIADAQLLVRSLPANRPERESAEAIQEAGWRLKQVVQRFMDFSRPTADAMVTVSVNETIQKALSLVSAQIEADGCHIETQLSEKLPALPGNPGQLENLWVYLLLLARDACNQRRANGYQPTIRVFSKNGPGGLIVIEIRDNGAPIPTDQLALVFEPNFIGPTSGRGTGMELSICREIVRQHGGQITADSSPEQDTIFRIALSAEV